MTSFDKPTPVEAAADKITAEANKRVKGKKRGPKAKTGPKPKKKSVGRPSSIKKVVISDVAAAQLGEVDIDNAKLLKIAAQLEAGEKVKGFCLAVREDAPKSRYLTCLIDYKDRFSRKWKLCINKADV